MITHRPTLLAAAAAATLVLVAEAASALTFTCSSVNRQDLFDPDSARLSSKLEQPAVNSGGDVVFLGRTRDRTHKLYLYPAGGSPSVVAAEDGPAPDTGTFTKFDEPSINDAGDIAFFGDLSEGEGVFVRPSGGPIATAARTGDASPGGGTFLRFFDLSTVNAAGDVAFIAQVDGGPDGVFVYDTSADTVFTVALVGDATGGGKTFCSFVNVALGGTDRVAFQTVIETSCGVSHDATSAIFREAAVLGSFIDVAEEGSATPIAGSTYAKFFDIDSNDAGDVGFRAKFGGTEAGTGVFLFDPSGPSTTLLARSREAAPRSGGLIKTIPQIAGVTNTDQVAFRGKVTHGSAKHGVFLLDGTDDAAVLNTDTVPNDLWGTTAKYRNIDEDAGVSRSGTWVTFVAKVKDQQTPSGNGVFRCEGS